MEATVLVLETKSGLRPNSRKDWPLYTGQLRYTWNQLLLVPVLVMSQENPRIRATRNESKIRESE